MKYFKIKKLKKLNFIFIFNIISKKLNLEQSIFIVIKKLFFFFLKTLKPQIWAILYILD